MSRQQGVSLGSIYQRGDGYWAAAFVLGGKRIVRYAKTERGAREKLVELQRQHSIGTLTAPTKLRFGEWVDRWLTQHSADLRPSTAATSSQVLRPLVARVGHVRLDRLTPLILSAAIHDLRVEGMGVRRIQMACTYIRTCLKAAVEVGIIGSNPADRVKKPRCVPDHKDYWDEDQMRRFVAAARSSGHQHAPLLVFLLASGCRLGEALGLRWQDVDMKGGTVRVSRSLVWVGNTPVEQKPKTAAGERTIALPGFGLEAVRHFPRPVDATVALFRTENGATPTKSNVRRALHALCIRADVPPINVHGLRHVHTALLLAHGVDPQALRRRLGHAHVSMTLDRYAYAVRPDADAASVVERALASG